MSQDRMSPTLPPDTHIDGWDHCEHGTSIGSLCTDCGAVVSYAGPMDLLGS